MWHLTKNIDRMAANAKKKKEKKKNKKKHFGVKSNI